MTSWEAALPVIPRMKNGWSLILRKCSTTMPYWSLSSARPISLPARRFTGDYPANHGIHPPGTIGRERGFYSALDADSEGEEGRYYVWDKSEIEAILGEDAAVFNDFYGVTAEGNWEQKNILTRPGHLLPEDPRVERARLRLLEHRGHRIRPALDDKILLGWNALMNIACCKAYGALGEKNIGMGHRNMHFIFQHLKGRELYFFYHSYKAGQTKFPCFPGRLCRAYGGPDPIAGNHGRCGLSP